MTNEQKLKNDLIQYAIDGLNSISEDSVYGCDLHHELFNTDFYTQSVADSIKVCDDFGGAFKAIHKVITYEKEMFGEVSYKYYDPTKVANMLVYILGQELLMECPSLENCWDFYMSEEDIQKVKEELEMQIYSI